MSIRHIRAGRRGAEKRAEGREAILRELRTSHPQLIPLFRRHAHKFRAGHAGLEDFLHFAHETSQDEVWATVAQAVDRDVADMIRDYQANGNNQ